MPARVILIHESRRFADELAFQLRALGHDVRTFDNVGLDIPEPKLSDILEVVVHPALAGTPGLHIEVIGHPPSFTGLLHRFVPEPAAAETVMEALESFLP